MIEKYSWIWLSQLAWTGVYTLRAERSARSASGRGRGRELRRARSLLHGHPGNVDGRTVGLEDDGAKSGKVRLRGYSCPLASTVAAHPEVCRLIEALLAEVVGAPVKECCDRSARPRCGFEIATGRRRAA